MDRSSKRRQVKPLAASLLEALDYDSSDDSDFKVGDASDSEGSGNGSEDPSKDSGEGSCSDSEENILEEELNEDIKVKEEQLRNSTEEIMSSDKQLIKMEKKEEEENGERPRKRKEKEKEKEKEREKDKEKATVSDSAAASAAGTTPATSPPAVTSPAVPTTTTSSEEQVSEPKKWNLRRNRPLLDFVSMEELNDMDDYDSEDDNDWRPTVVKRKGRSASQKEGSDGDNEDDDDEGSGSEEDENDEGNDEDHSSPLVAGMGDVVNIWAGQGKGSPPSLEQPYLTHRLSGNVHGLQFCPFEDVLGVGHSGGITSMLVPGAAEPNFDGLESNPYRSRKQRQEWEVKALLEKVPAELICLDPRALAEVDVTTLEQQKKERIERLGYDPDAKAAFQPKAKQKGRSSTASLVKRKKKVMDQEHRDKVRQSLEQQQKKKQDKAKPGAHPSALDRFVR